MITHTRRRLALKLIPAAALMVSIAALSASATPRAPVPERWVSLFNGKDLEGWTPKIKGSAAGENYADTFRVEDGVIKVSYAKYGKFNGEFGHLFYKSAFSNYRLRVEYRFVGEQATGGPSWAFRNSGVMIHGQSPESMRKDQEFPVSIEVQFLGGTGKGERSTGNLCTPGTNVVIGGKLVTQHCTNSSSKTYNGDQWVSAEVEVHGAGTIKHIINGQTVLEYEQTQLDPSDSDGKALIDQRGGRKLLEAGTISLQAESHPVEFRKVEIMELKD